MIVMALVAAAAALSADVVISSAASAVLQDDSHQTQSIRLVGRLVDEDGQPICNARVVELVAWSYWKHDRGAGDSAEHFGLESDAQGRFEFELPTDERHPGAQRAVRFFAKDLEAWEIALPTDSSSAQVDLGDVSLVRPGSIRWLAKKDDAQLAVEYKCAAAALERQGSRPVDTCLTEMVRRRGAHWQDFVASELARERAKRTGPWIEDLELLTALRRIQGKPDPLAIQLVGVPELECSVRRAPTIALRMLNVDVDGDVFQFKFGQRIPGEPPQCRRLPADAELQFAVEVRDASGTAVPMIPMEPMNGSALDLAAFEQGVEVAVELPLDRYVKWPSAGEFQVRVLYHNQCYIAGQTNCAGWITSATSWFTVHVIGK